SLLLSGATMSQQSSLTQSAHSVRQVLTAYTMCKLEACTFAFKFADLRGVTMAQKLSGGCACGAIHYECSADPVRMLNCHCRDCQQASGSAYAAIVIVKARRLSPPCR